MPFLPTTGTFRLYPRSIAGLEGVFTDAVAPAPPTNILTPEEVAAYLRAGTTTGGDFTYPQARRIAYGAVNSIIPGTYRVEVNPDLGDIRFNPITNDQTKGGTSVDFFTSGFPMGFLAQDVQVLLRGATVTSGVGQFNEITLFRMMFNTETITKLEYPAVINLSGTTLSGTQSIVATGISLSSIQTFGQWGAEVVVTSLDAVPVDSRFEVQQLYIIGNYTLWSADLTKTPDVGGPGTTVTINDNVLPGKLLEVTHIRIYAIDPADDLFGEPFTIPISSHWVITWTATQLVFTVPLDMNIPYNVPLAIAVVVDGVTFDGEVGMGTLSPILADGSGIYVLRAGKRSDTYYDRSVSPVVEVDVKIPNPLIKTGFFSG